MVKGHSENPKEKAHKSPQSVISNNKFCGLKNVLISQPVFGQFATGTPRSLVSNWVMFWTASDAGIEERCSVLTSVNYRLSGRVSMGTNVKKPDSS